MAFKTMPKELVLKLLEGHEDTLSEPLQELHARIKAEACPSCGIPMVPRPDFERPFTSESHIPRYQAYCTPCDLVMDIDTSKISHPKKDAPA